MKLNGIGVALLVDRIGTVDCNSRMVASGHGHGTGELSWKSASYIAGAAAWKAAGDRQSTSTFTSGAGKWRSFRCNVRLAWAKAWYFVAHETALKESMPSTAIRCKVAINWLVASFGWRSPKAMAVSSKMSNFASGVHCSDKRAFHWPVVM